MNRPALGVALGSLLLVLGCGRAEKPQEAPAPQETPNAGEQAVAAGGQSTLGAHFRALSLKDRQQLDPPPAGGIVIVEVLSRGPAQKARLASGDVILAVDGAAVKGLCDFYQSLGQRPPGQEVKLSIQRRNATFDASVTLAPIGDLYEVSCLTGGGAGCLLLGWAKGPGPEAVALFEKSCQLGLGDGCGV